MTSLGVKLYTDEDVDTRLAEQLGQQGYDVLSCRDAGNHNRGLSDEWQLTYATQHGRAIMVYNVADYMNLDAAWRTRGAEHSGIIVAQAEWAIGELVRRTRCHLDTIPPQQQHNIVMYLVDC